MRIHDLISLRASPDHLGTPRFRAMALVAVMVVAGFAMTARGDDRPWLTVRHWRTTDGLPQNSVNALAQTADGYLWIATYDGLARFDGRRIDVFNRHSQPVLPSSRVLALHVDDRNVLWLATDDGVLYSLEHGVFVVHRLPPEIVKSRIIAIDSDAEYDVWVLNREGLLSRVRDDRTLVAPLRDRIPRGPTTFARDPSSGQLYLLHLGLVSRVGRDRLELIKTSEDAEDDSRIIGPDATHGIWIATRRNLLRLTTDGFDRQGRPLRFPNEGITALVGLPNGSVAIASSANGVIIEGADGVERRFDAQNALEDNWARCLLLDRAQTLWVGASVAGLASIQSTGLQLLAPPREWGLSPLKSVAPGRDGGVWAGSEGGGLLRYHNGTWTRFSTERGLSNPFVWSVHEDEQGRVWTATWGGGLFVFNGKTFDRLPGLADPTASIAGILATRDGSHWMATTQGLWRQRPTGEVERYGVEDGRKHLEVRTLAEGPDGSVWLAPSSGGLLRWIEGRIEPVAFPHTEAKLIVSGLHVDERGVVWFGALTEGLFRYDGAELFNYDASHGIPQDTVTHLAPDNGHLWVSTTRAILRAPRHELDEIAAGRSHTATVSLFGVEGKAAASPRAIGARSTACRTADGILWFATSDGLVRLDPDLKREARAPMPLIEQISIDGSPLPVDSIGKNVPLSVPPGSERVEFRFTAPEFQAPESLQFRFRLKGEGRGWVNPGLERSASYHRLPPGDYVFELEVAHGTATGSIEQPFSVLPTFWQRTPVRAAGYGLAALAIAGLVSLRARAVHRIRERELRRQQALDRERTRIARDIHDDLGASLTRINLITQSARRDLARPEEAARRLDQIASTARQLTHKMDEIVWAVSPRHDSLESVAHYLANFAQEHLADAEISCRLDFPLTLPHRAVYAESRHHLFLAFQEAIHNVIKHSGATRVQVAMRPQSDTFSVTVEDNGRGIQSASLEAPRRNGLENMQRRLAEIGGKCEIGPATGGGTRIHFDVPYDRPGEHGD